MRCPDCFTHSYTQQHKRNPRRDEHAPHTWEGAQVPVCNTKMRMLCTMYHAETVEHCIARPSPLHAFYSKYWNHTPL